MKNFKFLPFIIYNTSAYLPYLLFILISKQYSLDYPTFIPLILFFILRYTGGFLLTSFSTFETRDIFRILKISTLSCSLALLIGTLTYFNNYFLIVCAVMLGLASSIQVPLYTTILLQLKEDDQALLKNKDYLIGLIFIFALAAFLSFLITKDLTVISALIYSGLYLLTYYVVKKYHYQEHPNEQNIKSLISIESLYFFIQSAGVILITKLATYEVINTYLIIFTYFIIAMISALPFIINRYHKNENSERLLWLSTIIGALVNYYFLIGTFYAFALKDIGYLVSNIYLSFLLGSILSIIFKKILYQVVHTKYRLVVVMGGTVIMLLLTNYNLFIAGVLCGIINGLWNIDLNKIAFKTSSNPDFSLLLRSRFQKIGSIFNQIFIVCVILVFSLISNYDKLPLFGLLSGTTKGYAKEISLLLNDTKYFLIIFYIALLMYWYFSTSKNSKKLLFK